MTKRLSLILTLILICILGNVTDAAPIEPTLQQKSFAQWYDRFNELKYRYYSERESIYGTIKDKSELNALTDGDIKAFEKKVKNHAKALAAMRKEFLRLEPPKNLPGAQQKLLSEAQQKMADSVAAFNTYVNNAVTVLTTEWSTAAANELSKALSTSKKLDREALEQIHSIITELHMSPFFLSKVDEAYNPAGINATILTNKTGITKVQIANHSPCIVTGDLFLRFLDTSHNVVKSEVIFVKELRPGRVMEEIIPRVLGNVAGFAWDFDVNKANLPPVTSVSGEVKLSVEWQK